MVGTVRCAVRAFVWRTEWPFAGAAGRVLASSFSAENSPVRRLPDWVLDHKKNASPARDGRSAPCLWRPTADRTLLSSLIRDSNTPYRKDFFPSVKNAGLLSTNADAK